MLNLLTNIAQSAVEQGYFAGGEEAVLKYISEKNPNVYGWVQEHSYEIRVGLIDNYAAIMVCDDGKPVFEDTFCESGPPDKDHRGNTNQEPCEITMTREEVKDICK